MSLLHFSQVDPTYTTTEVSSTASASAASAILVIFSIVLLLWAIPAIITAFQLYKKAGKPGWAAIVPIYNIYVMGEIAGKTNYALIYIACALTSAIPILGIITGLVGFVMYILLLVEFIKKYNGGVGFWISYILLPIVAVFLVKNVTFKGSGLGAAGMPMAGAAASPMGYGPAAAPAQPVYGQAMQPDPAMNPTMQTPVQPVAPQAPVAPVYGQPVAPAAPAQPVADQNQQFPPSGPMPPQPPVPPVG